MKAFEKMDNLDKGELLCKLFPEELENLQNAIKEQCEYFLNHEATFREGWTKNVLITAGFWYKLVQNAHKGVVKNENKLWERPHWFIDYFFDGLNALFAIHSLIEYADKEYCNPHLRLAIHFLFGEQKMIVINLND